MNIWESQMGVDLARVIMATLPEISRNLERIADAMEKGNTDVFATKEVEG